ncbi:MAG: ABC transporter substrate-binding protein, partial [Flavobacteriia bacterium]|nr:ABC transporter substrate-binding protein [Flavobacteriia bacterium]
MKAKFSGQRLFRWGLLGSIFLGAFLGCSDPSESSTGLVFRYNEPTSLSSLDPAFARDQGHTWVAKQLFSTLVDTDSALEIQPNLALSWSSDASGMHWEFKLRRGVYFHDDACFPGGKGRQLWAQDVVYSLQRLLDPQTASPGAWVLENVAKVSVLDSFTLAIDLKAFDPALLGRLAMPYCGIVPVEALEAYGSGFSEHPVGSGPFRFQAWARQEKLVLRRHPSYYEFDAQGQRLPYLEAVAIRFIP